MDGFRRNSSLFVGSKDVVLALEGHLFLPANFITSHYYWLLLLQGAGELFV